MSKQLFGTEVVGKLIEVYYKRSDRDGHVLAMEVTSLNTLVDQFGRKNLYVFGTRMDPLAAGRESLLRVDCCRPGSLKVLDVVDFKPIEGYAEGEWYFTPSSSAFAPTERVQDTANVAWAVGSLGAKNLKACEVKPEA